MHSKKEDKSYFYGDPVHLKRFRFHKESYRAILQAIREVLEDYGTLMPIIAEDVFGRHTFLGGVQAARGMTPFERAKFFSSRKTFLDSVDDGDGTEAVDTLEQSESIESVTSCDFFELVSLNYVNEDVHDHRLLQRLKDFFVLANQKGDLHLVNSNCTLGQPSGRIAGYALHEGGRFDQPPIGELSANRQKPAIRETQTEPSY